MAIKVNTLLAFPLLLLLLPFASSHNITTILSNFPEFSSFNDLLSRTGVASQINSRATITVLAVDNGAASAISSRPPNELRNILAVHVVLDYYDADKLQKLANHTAILTTLFQTTGLAAGHNGFLNVTDTGNSQVAFGSAAPGSGLVSNLVKVVAEQPYNISVLQVSSVVVPPGIDGAANNGSGNSSATGAPAHAPPSGDPAPEKAPSPAGDAPPAGSPASEKAPSPAGDAPPAGSPASEKAPSPAGDAPPAGSPASEKAPSPAGDAPSSEASAAPSSGSSDASPAPAADGPSDSPAEGPGGAGDEAADGAGNHSAAEKAVAGLAGVAAAISFAALGSL
ncbi:fasciclin-like arabinogalactan protein 14 [Zingiber officinale]|uniref:FAS1 domain-containing protein n=1 Tax=Zingiber officinale TaxID=94328 RepID=A0A8J5LMA0_ZINOF|nr:fasciclin-like arabinogalactan protein 14 [Zingiber officinale]KAG6525272.1 hypothetical protein ZIOFF_015226 [Zingiber officinale]